MRCSRTWRLGHEASSSPVDLRSSGPGRARPVVGEPRVVARLTWAHAVEGSIMITEPSAEPEKRHRSVWLWVSVALLVVAAGVFVWGLTVKSDLDSTQSDLDKANAQVSEMKAQAEQSKGTAGAFVTAAKTAYDELAAQLGATNEDLQATTEQLNTAQQTADQAEKA